jgi:hypothetical protein
MNGQRKLLTRIGAGVLALALLAVVPNTAHATGMGFCNNTKSRILVQGYSIVNRMIRKGPVLVVDPGKTVYDIYVPPMTPRTITIADGLNPNRILYNGVIPVGTVDMLFSVQPLPNGLLQLAPK